MSYPLSYNSFFFHFAFLFIPPFALPFFISTRGRINNNNNNNNDYDDDDDDDDERITISSTHAQKISHKNSHYDAY